MSLRTAHLLVFSPLPFWVYKKRRLLLYFLCPALQSAIPPGALVYLGCVHFRKCNPGIWNGELVASQWLPGFSDWQYWSQDTGTPKTRPTPCDLPFVLSKHPRFLL